MKSWAERWVDSCVPLTALGCTSLCAATLLMVGSLVANPAHATSGGAPATVSSATITANETWTQACSPYLVTNNVTIQSGAIVTIEPGVQVKFNSARSLTVGSGSTSGGLIAAG